MDASQQGQVTRSAADIYEEFFVPALFAAWPGPVADAAGIGPGQKVLDVACGTGVLAREAASRVRPGGTVTGLDRNDGMLAVARRKAPEIEWRQGEAEALPFPDGRFDAVVSQFGLMFFEDRVLALAEMWRVLGPGGRLAVAVWDALERTPGYAAMTALLQRLFGARIADALRAPYCLGDPDTCARWHARSTGGQPWIARSEARSRVARPTSTTNSSSRPCLRHGRGRSRTRPSWRRDRPCSTSPAAPACSPARRPDACSRAAR
jgi:SAM-dependent methyltransferase